MRKLLFLPLLALPLTVIIGVVFSSNVEAARNTIATCSTRTHLAAQGTTSDGRNYVTIEYRLVGNDYARRMFFFGIVSEPGSTIGSNQGGCNHQSSGFWSQGRYVDPSNGSHQALYSALFGSGTYQVQDIYLGVPNIASSGSFNVSEPYCGNPGIGANDQPGPGGVPWRVYLGISNCVSGGSSFASVNDAGIAFLYDRGASTNVAWCSGMGWGFYAAIPECRGVDAGTVYAFGGDFAGHQNNNNANARNNLDPALAARAGIRWDINSFINFNPTDPRFELMLGGSNTRDATPPFWQGPCLDFPPQNGPCQPVPGLPDDIMDNNKTSFYLSYIVDRAPEYDYQTDIQPVTPDTATTPKPGQTITVRGRVRNTDSGNGPTYRHRIQSRVGSGSWSNILDLNKTPTGLSGNSSSPWRNANFTVPANTAHNEQICFRSVVSNPVHGFSGGAVTDNGPRFSPETCYSVYNLRFHITPISVPGNYGPITPGSTIDITYGYGNTHPLCCNATRGPSTNLNVALSVPAPFTSLTANPAPYSLNANQSDTQTFTIDIPVDAPIGITCGFTLTLSPEQGYSDGTSTSGTRTASTCIEVHDFAFLKVHNSGVWNGAIWGDLAGCRGFALDFALNPQIVPEDVRGQISSNIGSSAEFGVTSMVTAITEFASAIVKSSSINTDDNLTFANSIPGSSGLGNFLNGATQPARCLIDLYNELIDPALSTISTAAEVSNTNPYSSGDTINKESQAVVYNSPVLGALPSFNNKVVLLRDGDLFIDSNIEYNTDYGDNGQLYIPSLVVITYGGDINIDADVTRLDGLYISVPEYDSGGNLLGGGNINTCFSVGGGVNSACETNPRIEVTGAFISNDIDFYRFAGGFRNALIDQTNNPGSANQDPFASELFTLNPELYISNPFSGLFNIAESVSDIYDSFTEKAPVY